MPIIMGMKIHIAADTLAKGLDPAVPHRMLAADGTLAVLSKAETKPSDVILPSLVNSEATPELLTKTAITAEEPSVAKESVIPTEVTEVEQPKVVKGNTKASKNSKSAS